MSAPIFHTGAALAARTLASVGYDGTITWPGQGGTALRPASSLSQSVRVFVGKASTAVGNDQVVTSWEAVMSPVARNPVGAKVEAEGRIYTVVSSQALGDASDVIAAHKLVLR